MENNVEVLDVQNNATPEVKPKKKAGKVIGIIFGLLIAFALGGVVYRYVGPMLGLGMEKCTSEQKEEKEKEEVKEDVPKEVEKEIKEEEEKKSTSEVVSLEIAKLCTETGKCEKSVELNGKKYQVVVDVKTEAEQQLSINGKDLSKDNTSLVKDIVFLKNGMIGVVFYDYISGEYNELVYYDSDLTVLKKFNSVHEFGDVTGNSINYTVCGSKSEKEIQDMDDSSPYASQEAEVHRVEIQEDGSFKDTKYYSYTTFCSAQD